MKRFNEYITARLIIVMCLSVLGCSDANNEKPAASSQTESNELSEARVHLDDGVYRVISDDEASPKPDAGIKIIDLVNVPVEGSDDSTPDKIRVIGQPLLRFRNVSHFDFTFEEDACTEVGFQNTDELKAYTRDHVGSRLAVVIDNKVITHHKIREAIESDNIRITCCTVGGGDHLHKHLNELKLATASNDQSSEDD